MIRKSGLLVVRRLLALVLLLAAPAVFAVTNFDKGLDAYGDGLYREAARYWTQSAKSGDARSRFNLAVLYEHGKGVEQDIEEAVVWYRQAAKSGFADAQFSLANILMSGAGPVDKNVDEGLMWYLQAADAGHIQSQFIVGSILVDGELAPKDLVTATSWLKLASANGHMEAESLLHRLAKEREANVNNDDWILEQDPTAFTVELFQSPQRERATRFVQIVGLESATVYESADGIHHVLAGVFDTEQGASDAVDALPEPLRLRLPKIRQFDDVLNSLAE